jgi:gamma-glutamyltranspeptidase
MGPPSSEGSTVGEALNILEGYDLSSMTRVGALHYYLEASRYSFADRNAYLADPSYYDVLLSSLLSKDYAATRRALIKDTAAPGAVPPGDPFPFEGAETTTHPTTSDKAETSSRTRSRSSRRAAPGSSCPASASCSTTS